MEFECIECKNAKIAVLSSEELVADVPSALELLITAKYEVGTKYIVIDKTRLSERFFILSTGLAGEILQKFVDYGGKIAIYGDFAGYTSKPLKDFIYESNHGSDVFFARTKEEAVRMLAGVIQINQS